MVFYKYHLSSPHSSHSTNSIQTRDFPIFHSQLQPTQSYKHDYSLSHLDFSLCIPASNPRQGQHPWRHPSKSVQVLPREWDSPSYVLAPVPSLARCYKPEQIYHGKLSGTYRVWHNDSPRLGSHHRAQCDWKCCGASARLSSSSWSSHHQLVHSSHHSVPRRQVKTTSTHIM